MQNSSGIKDKVVVITGASSGIGEAGAFHGCDPLGPSPPMILNLAGRRRSPGAEPTVPSWTTHSLERQASSKTKVLP